MNYRNGDSVIVPGKIIGSFYDDLGKKYYQISFEGSNMSIPILEKYIKIDKHTTIEAKEYKNGRFK